jgi:glycosyltransferase involved in cell wall biosynthesis
MVRENKVMLLMPEFGLAGAEIMVENLAVALAKDGINICVVSLYDYKSAITERLENQNIKVIYLGKSKGLDFKVFYKLYKLFKYQKPNIIHTHRYVLPYVMPVALLSKIPVKIHTIHNMAKNEVGKLQRKINYFFYKYSLVIPVSISPIVKESVIKEYNLSDEQVPMVYNGIDLEKCIQKQEYINNGIITVLHIGRFTEQKNHIGLIESFKLVHDAVPNTVLKLIGTGDLEPYIRQKVMELKLEDCVEFLGLKHDVYPYLNESDIFVLPSLWEGMPITLIEAMATGLPIVATSIGGVPDMIDNNVTGLLVNTNKEDISAAILKLVEDDKLRQELGKAAMIASERFSVNEMKNQYITLYGDTIRTPSK